MEQTYAKLRQALESDTFIQGTMSLKRNNVEKTFNKVTLKPFMHKEGIRYQVTYHYDKKVTHQNMIWQQAFDEIKQLMDTYFRNANFYTKHEDIQVMTSKKGKVKVLSKKASKEQEIKAHNREKKYIIREGEACDFLMYLGIMSSNYKIHAKKYDKFKQINKFLEIVEDSLQHLDKSKTVDIIDFGCGKAYLTFALYYYLVKKQGYKVNIIGLDLKEDVIEYCNKVARELDYQGLNFLTGDIRDYNDTQSVDMVITLHACDIATDAALSKAVGWDAKVILSVPCCQHELFKQIENPVLEPMMKHGLIKERLSALVTDAMRTQLLESVGYEVSVIEFVDMEHTPKNLMIKGIQKSKKRNEEAFNKYNEFKDFFKINPYLEEQLMK